MELGLHFTELTCCEQTGRLVMSHEETMETAIAEYCPDMTRIVSVCGQLQIRERTALEGRVTATGTHLRGERLHRSLRTHVFVASSPQDVNLALVGGDTMPTAIFVPAVRKYEKVLLNHEFDGFYRKPIRWLRRFSGEPGGNGLPL